MIEEEFCKLQLSMLLHQFQWGDVLLIDTYFLVHRLSCSVMSNSFVTPWTVACQAPLSMGFPRQEYWTGLPFPSPGDLPNPGIKPTFPASQVDSLSLSHWEAYFLVMTYVKFLVQMTKLQSGLHNNSFVFCCHTQSLKGSAGDGILGVRVPRVPL